MQIKASQISVKPFWDNDFAKLSRNINKFFELNPNFYIISIEHQSCVSRSKYSVTYAYTALITYRKFK